MRVLLPLIWKEYREYRLPVLLCILLLCALDYLCRSTPEVSSAESLLITLPMIVMAVFFAAHVIGGERSHRTELTMAALPIRRSMRVAIRVLMGGAAVLVPLAALVAFIRCVLRDTDSFRSGGVVSPEALLTSGLGIYAWTLFLAAGCRARGTVMIFGVFVSGVSFLCLMRLASADFPVDSTIDRLVYALSPALLPETKEAVLAMARHWPERTLVLLAALSLGGIKLAVKRPIDEQGRGVRTNATATQALITRVRERKFFTPLGWKAYREIRDLALAVVGINLFFALALSLAGAILFGQPRTAGDLGRELLPILPKAANVFWVVSGSILVIAMAVRITNRSFALKAADFWRSRPINPLRYLESQALAGAAAILLGGLFFGAMTWLIPQGEDLIRADVIYTAHFALAIQILVFPAALAIGSLTRSALFTASASSAVLITLSFAGVVAAERSSTDLLLAFATCLSGVLFVMVSLLWRMRLRVFPFKVWAWTGETAPL